MTINQLKWGIIRTVVRIAYLTVLLYFALLLIIFGDRYGILYRISQWWR